MKTKSIPSKLSELKLAFTIFKEGTTVEPVKIMYNPSKFYDIDAKVRFYLSLGYSVTGY